MFVPRLATVVAVLLTACAAWESPSAEAPPPAESPVPSSHYAPPPPASPNPEPAPLPEPQHVEIRVAIASVQLIEDCPEPVPAVAPAGVTKPTLGATSPTESVRAGQAGRTANGDGASFPQPCSQSMVQLSLQSDVPGAFRIDAVRLIDPRTKRVAGTTKLRAPTRWDDGYGPWDGQVVVKTELKISYKLGEPDVSRAAERGLSEVNSSGPFILELDVAVDGHRQTIRSSEFYREPPHMVVT